MAHKQRLSPIEKLWGQHCAEAFPHGLAGEEVAGVCLAYLDSLAGGCIQTFLADGGKLEGKETDKIAVLDLCHRDLTLVVPQLNGNAKRYFARLGKLARQVLSVVRRTRIK